MSSASVSSASAPIQREGFPEYEGYPGYDIHDPRERLDQCQSRSQSSQQVSQNSLAPPGGASIPAIDNNLLLSLNENVKTLINKMYDLDAKLHTMDKRIALIDQSLAVMNVTIEKFGSNSARSSSSASSHPDKRINIGNLVSIKKSLINYALVNGCKLTIFKTDNTSLPVNFMFDYEAQEALEKLNNEISE